MTDWDDAAFAAYRAALLSSLRAEDRLPGPHFRDLAEVVAEHGPAEPHPGWQHRAVTAFCEAGWIQLEDHALAPPPPEGGARPVSYALTLLGLAVADGAKP
jgi:hypothetical protein